MKGRILALVLVIVFSWVFTADLFADCPYSGDIVDSIQGCLGETSLIDTEDEEVGGGIKGLFVDWTKNIVIALSLLSIGAIAYGGFLLTTAFGEDEKIKKGKDVVKWAILGFLAAISAGGVVRVVIELVFAVTN